MKEVPGGMNEVFPVPRATLLRGAVLALVVGAISGCGVAAAEKSDLREEAVHLLDRLAFGPAPGEVERVLDIGWQAWVEEQLAPERIDDGALEKRLESFPSLRMGMAETYRGYRPSRDIKPANPREERELELEKQRLREKLQAELYESVLVRAVESRRRLREVIVDFWRNHLNVSDSKAPYWANHYEENVLREHAFGRWEDLLMASAKHPAMLVYLDNHLSRKGEINENYAREVMELHTLGVDNHYTQRDVVALTRALTGWTCFWRNDSAGKEEWRFVFRENHHDTAPKEILGLRLDGAGGQAEGETAIRYLAHHEGTAAFLSRKLCRYLVSDDPPEDLVERVAAVFRSSRGDLPQVYRAILASPEFRGAAHRRTKFKTPFEFVVSALRATGARVENPGPALEALAAMEQPVFLCDIPTGYSDQAEAWLDPGALAHRWKFALAFARGELDGIAPDPDLVRSLEGLPAEARIGRAVETLLPGGADPALLETLRKDEKSDEGDGAELTLARILGSPDFQQQ